MEQVTPRTWASPVLAEIWQENQAVRARLLEAVRRLGEKQLAFQPAPGRWSIGEILDHLCLAERSMTRTISRLLQQAAGLGRIGHAGPLPARDIDLAAYNRRATAPDGVLPSPDRPLDRLLAGLEESRERLLEVSAVADGRVVGDLRLVHVGLGELNFYQWLAAVGAHDAKHLAQIEAIASHADFPSA
jgi:hypothetical protein